MKVGKSQLYRKMIVTPRLNLKCDGIKIRCAYVRNDCNSGWIIENFNNDSKKVWYKGKKTNEIVDMITEKYKDINITWSRCW